MTSRLAFALLGALSLAACASASKPGAMVASVQESAIIPDTSPLRGAITVADVTGGKETNPLWTSKVSNADFSEALRQTLAAHAMLAPGAEGRYVLKAELLALKQPLAGFNMSVTSKVRYVMSESGAAVFDETVEHKHTAKTNEAFLGIERLRLANEGSIKGNIGEFIRRLTEKFSGAPAAEAAPTPQS